MSRVLSGKYQVLIAGGAAILTTGIVAVRMPDEDSSAASGATARGGSKPAAVTQTSQQLTQSSARVGFEDAATFLDDNRNAWEVQTSTFNPAYFQMLTDSRYPKKNFGVEVLRNEKLYGGNVTPMRIIGYFPNISPDALHKYVVDRDLRLKWDKNYSMFAVLDPSHSANQHANASKEVVANTVAASIGKAPVAPSGGAAVQRTWACHCVSSSILQKLGVKGRSFQYERAAWQQHAAHLVAYRSIVNPRQSYPWSMHVALPETEAYTSFLSHLSFFFSRNVKKTDDTVFMHHQTIAFLPIAASTTASLEHALLDARKVGSVMHASFGNLLQENQTRNDATGPVSGTLMLMTSVNETTIPSGVPQWAQKRIAHFFTSQAYEMLYHCASKDLHSH